MDKPIEITILLQPITKKNSQRIIYNPKLKRSMIIPSKQYKEYEKSSGAFFRGVKGGIDYPVNVKATYYMPTRRRVDLTNLHEALHDILVHYGVLEDDNCRVIVSTDGSRVKYDKHNPRTEIVIERAPDVPMQEEMGYEMTDEERQLMDGTHELYEKGDEEQ